MKQEKSLPKKVKSKNLLWFAGLINILLGIFGICYGVFICYNGILIRNTHDEAILDLLNNSMLTAQEGMNALITFGTIIIIFYLLILGLGGIGVISSNHLIVRQTLFWICIFLTSLAIIFAFLGIFSITLSLINIIGLGFYGFALVRKYNKDLNKIKRTRKK